MLFAFVPLDKSDKGINIQRGPSTQIQSKLLIPYLPGLPFVFAPHHASTKERGRMGLTFLGLKAADGKLPQAEVFLQT